MTVIGCTLFRNFAGWGGTMIVVNVWPLISTVVRTDFIHNEALVVNNEWVYWTAPVRPREISAAYIIISGTYEGHMFSDPLFAAGRGRSSVRDRLGNHYGQSL